MTLIYDMLAQLEAHHCRITKRMRAVLQAAADHRQECLTAREIHAYAEKCLPGISIATVYRIISSFCKAGILRPLQTGTRVSHYELISGERYADHPCCICRKCGQIIGIFDPRMRELLSECVRVIGDSGGFQIDSLQVIGYGLCETCSRQMGKEGKADDIHPVQSYRAAEGTGRLFE